MTQSSLPEEPEKREHDAESENGEYPEFQSNWDLLLYLFLRIRENKKYYLIPFWLVLAFLGLFLGLTGNSSILPAIYAIF